MQVNPALNSENAFGKTQLRPFLTTQCFTCNFARYSVGRNCDGN